MKTKLTQEKWNDKRDAFLCAFITGGTSHHGEHYSFNSAHASAHELTSKLYEVEDHNVDVNELVEDSRPFNPTVIEIFNQYLPKEIAPLAIEAHKRSCEFDGAWLNCGHDLHYSLGHCIYWGKNKHLGDFESLYDHTKENTITATEEQLREWFPSAYQNEGGDNDL